MTNKKFNKLFGRKPRLPNQNIEQFHMDIAASIQQVTERVMIKLAKSIREEFNIDKSIKILVGISFGYEDKSVPANRTRVSRDDYNENVFFKS